MTFGRAVLVGRTHDAARAADEPASCTDARTFLLLQGCRAAGLQGCRAAGRPYRGPHSCGGSWRSIYRDCPPRGDAAAALPYELSAVQTNRMVRLLRTELLERAGTRFGTSTPAAQITPQNRKGRSDRPCGAAVRR